MKHAAHNGSTEAGFLFTSGWRRDSARRLPLRQTAPSIGRDLSPQYAQEVRGKSEKARLTNPIRRTAWSR